VSIWFVCKWKNKKQNFHKTGTCVWVLLVYVGYKQVSNNRDIMTDQYLTFQKFPDKESALQLRDLLKQNDIECIFEDTSGRVDLTFSNSESIKEFRVKLKQEDFEQANDLLMHLSSQHLDNVEKDYYLFDFTDEELMEIVYKADEWSQFDYLLAKKLLKERGKEIKPEVAETIKKQRI
jgi:hypothetical protein